MSKTYKKILIIKPSSLGDVVTALPALAALRRSFPDAHISWLIRPVFAPLIDHHPFVDRVIQFDRRFLGKAWYHPRAFAALVSLTRTLRNARFDAVFDFQGLFRTASLAWLSGCPQRFGMARSREFAHIFYTSKVPPQESRMHVVDYYLEVVRAAGAAVSDAEFILAPDDNADRRISELLEKRSVPRDNYAVLVPGSAHADKCWPVERFAALADRLAADFDLSIVATGSPSESPMVERLRELSRVKVENLAGQTSLAELTAVMRAARLVVTNDTGPGQIAAALGIPIVMIFGWSNPARVAPYHRDDSVAAVEPFGRGPKPASRDPKHHISNVTFEQVWDLVCHQLGAE